VSPAQFIHPGFSTRVRNALDEFSLAPKSLELELTEGMLLQKTDTVLQTMNALKELGIWFALDDFGTGYSSLSYLKRFPLDILKIDQSFVRDISTDEDDAEIVRAILALARALRLEVIAEGVETEEQLAFLAQHQCQVYQGYWFSRPVAPEVIGEMLAKQAESGAVAKPDRASFA
jgi:EAL domain-containing protein (putative c-di-GMP-specific phosphodiesterase class I)